MPLINNDNRDKKFQLRPDNKPQIRSNKRSLGIKQYQKFDISDMELIKETIITVRKSKYKVSFGKEELNDPFFIGSDVILNKIRNNIQAIQEDMERKSKLKDELPNPKEIRELKREILSKKPE